MAGSALQLEVQQHDDTSVVVAKGELDVTSTTSFAAALEQAKRSSAPLVVIDLSELQFIDSSGLAMLVKADNDAKAGGRRLMVVRGPHQVQHLLELTGLAERLELVDSLDEIRFP
jgi:anti-anti-sigma factor